jgi:hypothetical protein
MLVLEVGCAVPKGADIAAKYCKHGTTQTMFVVITSFSWRVSESPTDNIQRGPLRDRMTVTRGSSSTLEEEEEEEIEVEEEKEDEEEKDDKTRRGQVDA